jgi:uncharacterized membrane protein
MSRNAMISLVVLIIGVALLFWGFDASDSFASEVSEVVEGAPSNKSIALMVVGALLAVVGLFGLIRRGPVSG